MLELAFAPPGIYDFAAGHMNYVQESLLPPWRGADQEDP